VRKEAYVRPWLRRMERLNRYGVYFILKSGLREGLAAHRVRNRWRV